MQIYVFALIAIAFSDYNNTQTVGYYTSFNECRDTLDKIKPTINTDYVKLECVPVKVKDYK
jgi:hypothetical protein